MVSFCDLQWEICRPSLKIRFRRRRFECKPHLHISIKCFFLSEKCRCKYFIWCSTFWCQVRLLTKRLTTRILPQDLEVFLHKSANETFQLYSFLFMRFSYHFLSKNSFLFSIMTWSVLWYLIICLNTSRYERYFFYLPI